MNNIIDQIKREISIKDVVFMLKIPVDKRGFCFSIYKQEKTPSMKIYFNRNFFKCFATNRTGDQINLFADFYKIDLSEAIKELSKMLSGHTVLTKRKPVPDHVKSYEEKNHTAKPELLTELERDIFEERSGICEYIGNLSKEQSENIGYENVLLHRKTVRAKIYHSLFSYWNANKNLKVYNYLTGKNRKLKPETIEHFKLVSIKSVSQTNQFIKDTFSDYEIKISGLFSVNNYFLFTKHRLIIPFIESGEIVYLRGRYFDENGNTNPAGKFSKYLGLSNNYGGLHSKRFFNFDLLRAMKPGESIFITEGEFDAMVLHQNNYKSLGIPGTSNFPKDSIKELEKFTIHLCFDSDNAGQTASKEIAKLFHKPIFNYSLLELKDITELENDFRK